MTELLRLCFSGGKEAIYRHLLRCMELPPVTRTGHQRHHYVFLNPCETQPAEAGPPAAPDALGKDALQSNLCPPQAGARSVLPQHSLQEPENFCKLCQLAQARRTTLLAKNHLNAAAHWTLPLLQDCYEEEKKVYFILVNTAHTDISM